MSEYQHWCGNCQIRIYIQRHYGRILTWQDCSYTCEYATAMRCSTEAKGENNVPDTNVGDTISRQAAIDAISTIGRTSEWKAAMAVTLAGLPSAQQWIPVTERLPEANEEDEKGFLKAYLVQNARWMDVARWDGEYWIAWGYGTVLNDVVAWMPLPKPWEGANDGSK